MNQSIKAKAKPFHELTVKQQGEALHAFCEAHGTNPDLNFAPDRAWLECHGYMATLNSQKQGQIENLQRYKAGVNHTDNAAFVQAVPCTDGSLVLLADVVKVMGNSNE